MKVWTRYNPLGTEEKTAVNRVIDSGCLSQYIGAWHEDFNGGVEVKAFENEIQSYFDVPHAVVFNSLTSGLIAAIGALGIKPGDEVLVTPWTMSATATAITIWGGIPVFVDIEKDFYGLDPALLNQYKTKRTKGIIVTDIFGHGCLLDEIKAFADNENLFLIEDVAQAPGIKMNDQFLGTWGDIGGFSLNYHKHIHTGEGGFCICKDEQIAMKMRLIRNHAESAVEGSPISDLHNMVGFNFRMGEMEAAIGREQLKKLPDLLKQNQQKVKSILSYLKEEDWLVTTPVNDISEHAYYVLPFRLNESMVSNKELCENLIKRNVPGVVCGYVNVHKLPMYEQQIAFDKFPWKFNQEIKYDCASCPNAEILKERDFFGLLVSMYDMSEDDCKWIAEQIKLAYIELKIRT